MNIENGPTNGRARPKGRQSRHSWEWWEAPQFGHVLWTCTNIFALWTCTKFQTYFMNLHQKQIVNMFFTEPAQNFELNDPQFGISMTKIHQYKKQHQTIWGKKNIFIKLYDRVMALQKMPWRNPKKAPPKATVKKENTAMRMSWPETLLVREFKW